MFKFSEKEIEKIKELMKNNSLINFYELYSMEEYMEEDETLKYILDRKVELDELEEYKKKMNEYEPNKNEKIEILNVEKINNLWKKDKNYYISEKYEEIIDKNRYLNSRIYLLNIEEKIKEPQQIEYIEEEDLISFINGRNRFSNLRDLGCKEIPVIIYKKDKKIIEKCK